jgi:hypothetical protein
MKRILLILALLLCASPTFATITLVQHKGADVASTTSTTLSFTSATTGGNKIIVALRIGGTSTAAITDGTNTYNNDVSLAHTGLGTAYIFSVDNASSVTTLTCTLTGGAATIRWAIYEYSGIATSGSLDKTSSLYTAATSSSVNSGNTATTAQASELLFGALATNATNETTHAGTTQSYVLEDTVPTSSTVRLATEDVVVSATGAYQADFTNVDSGTDHIALIATYKAAGASTTPLKPPVVL